MERPRIGEQLPSFHPGYYETSSFEQIRHSLQAGDQILFRTRSGSTYSFILHDVIYKDTKAPFGATAELIDAPHHALAFEDGKTIWSGDDCFILFDTSYGSLQILFEPVAPTRFPFVPTAPTITTSRVVGFGVRKQN